MSTKPNIKFENALNTKYKDPKIEPNPLKHQNNLKMKMVINIYG